MAGGDLFLPPYELTGYCAMYTITSLGSLILYMMILFFIQRHRGQSPRDSCLVLGSWPLPCRIVFIFVVVLAFLFPLLLFLLASVGAAILKAAEG